MGRGKEGSSFKLQRCRERGLIGWEGSGFDYRYCVTLVMGQLWNEMMKRKWEIARKIIIASTQLHCCDYCTAPQNHVRYWYVAWSNQINEVSHPYANSSPMRPSFPPPINPRAETTAAIGSRAITNIKPTLPPSPSPKKRLKSGIIIPRRKKPGGFFPSSRVIHANRLLVRVIFVPELPISTRFGGFRILQKIFSITGLLDRVDKLDEGGLHLTEWRFTIVAL